MRITKHRKICSIVVLGVLSFIGNFFCYYTFNGKFIFIHSNVIKSSSGNLTIPRIFKITRAKERYVAGFIHPNPQMCPNLGSKLKVVIMVISSPDHFDKRMEIRRTWGQSRDNIAVAFLMGTTENEVMQKSLNAERLAHGDMIFGHFKDVYRNLTLKSMNMMQWVSEYCPKAHFLLKIDDDMYANIPRLLEVLNELNVDLKVMYGELIRWKGPVRQNTSRYFSSMEDYPEDVYPDYLVGPSYLLPASLASPIYQASLEQRFLPMEDVFITGIVAKYLNIERVETPGFQNDYPFGKHYGACTVFKIIVISKKNFYKYYKECEECFQSRSQY